MVEKANNVLVDLADSLKEFRGPPGVQGPHFENHWYGTCMEIER